MPGMDGLSMIAALRVEFPEMMIAILTGYRDFDYAQKAIRLGVNRFLLKPSNMDEIKEALQFMADTLNKRKEQENALKTQNTAEVPGSPAAEPEGAVEQELSLIHIYTVRTSAFPPRFSGSTRSRSG